MSSTVPVLWFCDRRDRQLPPKHARGSEWWLGFRMKKVLSSVSVNLRNVLNLEGPASQLLTAETTCEVVEYRRFLLGENRLSWSRARLHRWLAR